MYIGIKTKQNKTKNIKCNRPDSQLIQSNNRPNLDNPRTDNATESIVILLSGCIRTKSVPTHYESTI